MSEAMLSMIGAVYSPAKYPLRKPSQLHSLCYPELAGSLSWVQKKLLSSHPDRHEIQADSFATLI
jgi:hypothetical protein